MRKYTLRLAVFFSFLILLSCLEPYEPPAIQGDVGLLVVDGFLNGSENSALVKLSYASTLSSDNPPVIETGAFVSIEEEGGNVFSLNEFDPGSYAIDNLLVDENKRYRLIVRTSVGEEFFSEYIEMLNTPEIDSVTWKPDDKGVNVFVTTHDPTNKAVYFKWDYEETWEYNSSFYSSYKLDNGEAFPRFSNDQIFTCWTTTPSTEILVGSTTRLSEAIVRDFPITFVPGPTVKLSRRYSIDVRQRALSKEEYDFWTQLKKTTESLGGLFDELPTQVIGNMRGVNPDRPVLGYFSGGRVTSKRLFIRVQQLPDVLLRQRVTALCQQSELDTLSVSELPTTPNNVLLVDPIYVQGVGIVAFTTSLPICIDCKLQGGTTTQPPFW